MRRADRTTKILLGVIAALLAWIAARPFVAPDSPAFAQNGTVPTSFHTELVNRINYRDNVLGLSVMDSQRVFLVYTKNMVEVYRVGDLPIPGAQ